MINNFNSVKGDQTKKKKRKGTVFAIHELFKKCMPQSNKLLTCGEMSKLW